jgi:hypothetical protein
MFAALALALTVSLGLAGCSSATQTAGQPTEQPPELQPGQTAGGPVEGRTGQVQTEDTGYAAGAAGRTAESGGAQESAGAATTELPPGAVFIDFSTETVGAEPTSFVPTVGNWVIGIEEENKVLMVDGSKWSKGQTSKNIAEQARALYGDRYAEFLDNVQAYAYYPFAVMKDVDSMSDGEIRLRFKSIAGDIDQNAGILFGLQPNGDYYALRASTLEDNLVLWEVVSGKRSSLEWVRDTHTPTGEWHDLKAVIKGNTLEGYVDGQLLLTHTFEAPPTGKIGVWSKADSVVYFDDYTVVPSE